MPGRAAGTGGGGCGAGSSPADARVPAGRQRSSAPLQVLLFLHGWYGGAAFLLEALVFLYKVLVLPYPAANAVLDVAMLVLYAAVEATRIFLGAKGNVCERKAPLAVSVALAPPAAAMAAYYLLLQTYALRLEALLAAILLLFHGAELLLGLLALASFSRCGHGEGKEPPRGLAGEGRSPAPVLLTRRCLRSLQQGPGLRPPAGSCAAPTLPPAGPGDPDGAAARDWPCPG
ncbi:transmembrane protein 216 [Eudromia elegans]